MKITRDVVYDLLPGYFAGEVSSDTRALVDEFLRDDPEFATMMERFRSVFRDPRPTDGAAESRHKEILERARTYLQKRSELRGYVIAFGLATLFTSFVLGRANFSNVALWVIPGAFAATSVISAVQLYLLKARSRVHAP